VDGEQIQLSEPPILKKKQYKHDISVVVDRPLPPMTSSPGSRDSLETVARLTRDGLVSVNQSTRPARAAWRNFQREAVLPERAPGCSLRHRAAHLLSSPTLLGACPGVLRARHEDVCGLGALLVIQHSVRRRGDPAPGTQSSGKGLFNYFQRLLEGVSPPTSTPPRSRHRGAIWAPISRTCDLEGQRLRGHGQMEEPFRRR
jgi:excinuclease ABC subunit A